MQEIILLTRHITWTDSLDIIIVALFMYLFLRLIQGHRAYFLLIGLILFLIMSFLLFLVASVFQLHTVTTVLSKFGLIFIFIFVIIFQGDVRRIFVYLAQAGGLFWKLESSNPATEELLSAIQDMSKRKIGALILIQRMMEIKNLLEVGTEVDAQVQASLIKTIFNPGTPLHDGAMVIYKGRIRYAGAIISLSDQVTQLKRHGTRHRAAVSATEDSDVIALVVSEETGDISAAYHGSLFRMNDIEEVRTFMNRDEKESEKRSQSQAMNT